MPCNFDFCLLTFHFYYFFPKHPISATLDSSTNMAFYSKYRPQNFANLVGQDHIRTTLLHEILKGTLAHAYLFAGPRGTGKTSTARLIAKSLNCTNKNAEGEPCDQCDFCKNIRDGSLIDVIEIDAASNRGIDEIRDLKEKIQFAPTRAKTKTYIIDEIHMLTKEAFNALLKTLEEPPENVFFILCTTEIHKIPETIISRCQRFDFKRIDVKTLMTRLSYIAQMEGIEYEDAAIELIAGHVEGGMRDAIGLLEQMTIGNKLLAEHVRNHLGITGHQTIATLLELLEKKETAKAIHIVNEVHNEGYDLVSFAREILECLREKLISGIHQNKGDSEIWMRMIGHFEDARDMLRNTVIPQLPLEIAVIKICGAEGILTDVQQTNAQQANAPAKPEKETIKLEMDKTVNETAEKQETETASTLKKEFEMERYSSASSEQASEIGKNWPRVLEHIKTPSLRGSLADSKMSEGEDGVLKLSFGSRFHMEKVNTTENRAKIEKIIDDLFGKKVKIVCEFFGTAKKLPEAAGPATIKMPAKKLKEKEDQSKNIIDKAMEIFGEE